MITEDQIAAATMAQLFGSELLRVDQTTLERPNSASQAVRLDPKQFLARDNPGIQAHQKAKEQALIDVLNREAEAACPLPQPTLSPQTPQAGIQQPIYSQQAPTITVASEETLNKISSNIERIANTLETLAGIWASNSPAE